MNEEKKTKLLELQKRATEKSSDLSAIISEILTTFDAELWPQAKRELGYELNGFTDSAEYYSKPAREPHQHGYMPDRTMYYREREGRIVVAHPDGAREELGHEFAQRKYFFVSAPIKRLQELAACPDDEVAIEMPELSELVGAKLMLLCARADVQQMVDVMRRGIGSVIHLLLNPDTWDKMDEHSRIKRERLNTP